MTRGDELRQANTSQSRQMRLLITGVAGFIGSHLAEKALHDGWDVVGVDCFLPNLYDNATKQKNIRNLVGKEGFELHTLDLRSQSLSHLLERVDAVAHLAAMAGLGPSWSDFETYLSCNVLSSQRLAEALASMASPPLLVHGSTSSVYGLHAVGSEHSPLQPISPYGVSKLAAEQVIVAYRDNFGIPVTILRLFSVYGPGQRPDMAYARFCNAMLEGKSIKITGDGSQKRSNTHVSDVVRGLMMAAMAGPHQEPINICGSETISILDAVRTLEQALDTKAKIDWLPVAPGDQHETSGSNQRARNLLGWEPSITIDAGLMQQAMAARAVNREGYSLRVSDFL